MSKPPPVPPVDRGEQWQVVQVTDHRGRTRYELHKGWTRRVWTDGISRSPIRYRSEHRATRARDRLRRRDTRRATP